MAQLLVAASMLASAISGQDATGGLVFPRIPQDALVGTGTLAPCLPGAPGAVRCGRFRVFENREAQSGRTLDLAFVVAEALGDDSVARDAVTFFLGGPGSSATAQARGILGAFAPIRKSRDLLLIDFRGVGASEALSCDVPYPGGVQSRFDSLLPVDHVAACAERLSKRAQLDQYTSAASMDDVEDLRKFLGYKSINLYTGSYGTKEAQVYLRRHPDSIRTVVLDAVSPIFHKSYLSHARGLQDALDAVVAECTASTKCNSSYPRLAAQVEQVFSQVRLEPVKVEAEGSPVSFRTGALSYALRGLLYRQGAEVPYYIDKAASGDWQPLADYFLQRQGWVGEEDGDTGYHFSVICAESISFVTDEEVARQTANTFMGSFLIDAYRDMCKQWPHAKLNASFLLPVPSDVPALIFSGQRDPVTPPSKGDALEALMENSVHVLVPNGGHGTFGPCYQAMVKQLVESGSSAGLDLSCVGEAEATTFRSP